MKIRGTIGGHRGTGSTGGYVEAPREWKASESVDAKR